MKRETAFKILTSISQDRARSKANFLVKSFNKDGSVSRAAFTATDWQLNAFEVEADAEKRARALEALNPGKRFAVVPA